MEDTRTKPTTVFWIVGVLFLLWNIFGCSIYLADNLMSDQAYGEMYGQAMLDARDLYPSWAMAAYAIAVWGGLLAAIVLLLRKRLAPMLFVLSFVAAVICFIPMFTNAQLKEAAGSSFWVMPVIVMVLGLVEIWWSRKKAADGYLS